MKALYTAVMLCLLLFPARGDAAGKKCWVIVLEEPTGIYRRDDEIVTVKMNFAPGEAWQRKLRVVAAGGREIQCQIAPDRLHSDGSISSADVMFPITMIPGDRPEVRLVSSGTPPGPVVENSLVARRIGVGRLEIANDRFGVMVNLGRENTEPAIIAAFNKTAAAPRMLNLIDTSPDLPDAPPFGVKGSGAGTFLGGKQRSGYFDKVEILETGPLRARVVMSGVRLDTSAETWEFVWYAHSPVLLWKTHTESAAGPYGFAVSSVSASPYVPFDRWIDGSEESFPSGWETDNPPDYPIVPRDFTDLPGGHALFYNRAENYGALGFYEMDRNLEWKGMGSPQFAAFKQASGPASAEIALAFPRWKGTETVLEGRADFRRFTQPVLYTVRIAADCEATVRTPGPAESVVRTRPVEEIQRETNGGILDLALRENWKLNWAEKSEGERKGFQLTDFDDSTWRGVEVPGSAHVQMLPPPRYYTPEANWISDKEWWYRNRFRVPASIRGRRVRLRFEATDYYADIWLNGRLLGRHEGYIDPYEFEVAGALNLDRDNLLAVRVWTPVSYYWRHRPYTVKGSYGAVDQKPDRITAVGITRPVRIVGGGPVTISDVAVETHLNPDGSADVLVGLELDSGRDQAPGGTVTLGLVPRNFTEPDGLLLNAHVQPWVGKSRRSYTLHIPKPRLWWTWDHGAPALYTLLISVRCRGALSDRASMAVGIREIEHIDWKFYLNGKRMFVRGTNSYYNLFLSEMHRSDYERDIRMMRSMNVNMIRLHCHFSNPEFYDVADELGILVWQDYLEAWYPEDTAFALKAAGLYDPLIRYVRNHPSVAVWATSDEESLDNYRVLTKHLEPRLYALDPQRRPVVRSTGRYGDSHVYHGWYEGNIWEYTRMTEKFVSELGATALPNYESLVKFLPDAWPISQHREEWIFRKLQIPEAMRAWGEPGQMSLREYIPQTQDYVARLFQLALERSRRLKYAPSGGILHFHAIDIWPSVTMAAIDFFREPTKAFHTVRRSFQPVVPSLEYDREVWKAGEEVNARLWVINDLWQNLSSIVVSWRVENERGEKISSSALRAPVDIAADSARELAEVRFPAPAPGRYTLWIQITDPAGTLLADNTYEFQVRD